MSKKIIVISDCHNNYKKLKKILSSEIYDYAIHLGDFIIEDKKISELFDFYVKGNNDFFSSFDLTKLINIEGKNIFLSHGHSLGIHNKNTALKAAKKFFDEKNIDLFLFGHIHKPILVKIGENYLLNPGSISEPRSSDGATYAIIEINEGRINCKFKKC